MAAWRNPYDMIAIAAIVRDSQTGVIRIVSSKKVTSFTFEARVEGYGRQYIPSRTFRLDTEMSECSVSMGQSMAEQPHLTQRGVYLPDMSFRALPAPTEEK